MGTLTRNGLRHDQIYAVWIRLILCIVVSLDKENNSLKVDMKPLLRSLNFQSKPYQWAFTERLFGMMKTRVLYV